MLYINEYKSKYFSMQNSDQNSYPFCMKCSIYFDIVNKQGFGWKFIERNFHFFLVEVLSNAGEANNFSKPAIATRTS